MKKILTVLLFLFFCLNGKSTLALEINAGNYGKNSKLVKTLKKEIPRLHIYGKPELKKVEFKKGPHGCGFIVEYDELIKLGKAEFIQTNKKSLRDCANELLNFVKWMNYFYAVKELQTLGAEINRERVEIIKIGKSDFPVAVVGEYLVKVVLVENEFEFFIADAADRDNILFYAPIIEEVKKYLMENIPERIKENYEGREYYWAKNITKQTEGREKRNGKESKKS